MPGKLATHKILFFLFTFLNFSAFLFSQQQLLDKKVSVDIDNKPLDIVLKELSKILKTEFTFSNNEIQSDRITTIHASNASLRYILNELIRDEYVDYKIIGGHVVIYKSNKPVNKLNGVPENVQLPDKTTHVIAKQKIILSHKKVSSDTLSEHSKKYELINARKIDTVVLYHEPRDDYEKRMKNKESFIVIENIKITEIIRDREELDKIEITALRNHRPVVKNYKTFRYRKFRDYFEWAAELTPGIEGYYMPMHFFQSSYFSNSSESSYSELLNSTGDISNGTSYGLNVFLDYKSFHVKTGLGFFSFSDNYSFTTSEYFSDTSYTTKINKTEYWNKFLLDRYGEVNGTDTNWIEFWDSTWVTLYDTSVSAVFSFDTNATNIQFINHFRYVEIPLIMGYKGRINPNMSYNLDLGLILSYFSGGKVYLLDEVDNKILTEQQVPFLSYYLFFNPSVEYQFVNHAFLRLGPVVKYALIYNMGGGAYHYKRKLHSAGLCASLVYRF